MTTQSITIVTPTLRRAAEVTGLLENLCQQTIAPMEVIIVDGAPDEDKATEEAVALVTDSLPFKCKYIRYGGGTALQRNRGIDEATGEYVALIDDDVRLDPKFLEMIVGAFAQDPEMKVGGIVGTRTNMQFDLNDRQRWRWYRRLGLLTTYEPGRYDFESGYPVNANMQSPFSGVRKVDFMTTACAVWRREVFDSGLRFDSFFRDFGVLEDAHFSLRAGRRWQLLQCGDAHGVELHSPRGRINRRRIGYKCVVNYYYVFQDIVRPLTYHHKARFWRFQAFELFRIGVSAVRRRRWSDLVEIRGRLEGTWAILRGSAFSN